MTKKFRTVWEKMPENLRGDFFLTHTVCTYAYLVVAKSAK